jgi:hypothetical protein
VLQCWDYAGDPKPFQYLPEEPMSRFFSITWYRNCATVLLLNGTIRDQCHPEPPLGVFIMIDCAYSQDLHFCCAERSDHTLECWGTTYTLPPGPYISWNLGGRFQACGVLTNGSLVCVNPELSEADPSHNQKFSQVSCHHTVYADPLGSPDRTAAIYPTSADPYAPSVVRPLAMVNPYYQLSIYPDGVVTSFYGPSPVGQWIWGYSDGVSICLLADATFQLYCR